MVPLSQGEIAPKLASYNKLKAQLDQQFITVMLVISNRPIDSTLAFLCPDSVPSDTFLFTCLQFAFVAWTDASTRFHS